MRAPHGQVSDSNSHVFHAFLIPFLTDNHVRLRSSQNASYTGDVCDLHLRLTAKPHISVKCGTFHINKYKHAPSTIYWLKGIQVEHFSPCDRCDDISISRSVAPPTYWLSVKCHYGCNQERQIERAWKPQAPPTYWLSAKVSGMERWREVTSLLHSDQISSVK